jgi:hypothetical protein
MSVKHMKCVMEITSLTTKEEKGKGKGKYKVVPVLFS